ncbi:hypothetical protein PpBr36_00231 [Pyricularia pennisetigena]|uniref:hypothetical protein n=1 Tax=Pyricularia pennisetigena TaxID=1578925 RepID=UPI00114D5C9E|nr:hypothetical protein PpBr36_00231 [Pyricularia pennisetigena]TLS29528.1 hypothetical protein PpBr36_00231 [Pyricularia pennisetigena]
MSINPLITFKAGRCELDTDSKPAKVKCLPEPGYIYLYSDDGLINFCWRPRNQPIDDEPPLSLVMVPGDGRFVPYQPEDQPSGKTNGRILVLKFLSSSTRHLFWMQSKPQSTSGDPAWFSPRDRKIVDLVDQLLSGEEVDVQHELAEARSSNRRDDDDDDDETMEDADGHGRSGQRHQSVSGGAGPDATGGDIRREGEDAREGGADGARAGGGATDAATIVQNLLDSLAGSSGGGNQQQQSQAQGKVYPLLSDLLDTPTTIPVIDAADETYIDNLLDLLPATIVAMAADDEFDGEANPPAAAAAKASLSLPEKKALLKQVLRSPQFHQSLASLSMALRDGGLPTIAEALGVKVENGGLVRGGSVPLGGGEAIEAFVEGVRKEVLDKKR